MAKYQHRLLCHLARAGSANSSGTPTACSALLPSAASSQVHKQSAFFVGDAVARSHVSASGLLAELRILCGVGNLTSCLA